MKALEWSQQFSHSKSNGIFPDAQGQLTSQSAVVYGRVFFLNQAFIHATLTCWNKVYPIKNEGARVATIFPHYNPMGDICRHGNQFRSDLVRSLLQPFPSPSDASDLIKFDCNWSTSLRDIHACERTYTHGRQLESHHIRSPFEPTAQVS